jgi:hypothetical protein
VYETASARIAMCYYIFNIRRCPCFVLVEKPKGKRPQGRPRLRWKDNIKMDLQEVVCGLWTGLSWLRIEKGGGHL